jgi:hypothetical protein
MSLRKGVVGVVVAVAFLGACRRSPVDVNPIVPSMTVGLPRAPLGSPLEVTYKWTVEAGARPIPADHRAFVHFLDSSNKTVVFNDDHVPVPPPDQWKPGQTYTYTRTVFIPVVPYVGAAHLIMGLYPSSGQGQRIALKAEDIGMQAYKVGSMELLPQTEAIFLVRKDGWHNEEAQAQDPERTFTWTKKEALVSFKNPKRDVIVYLDAETNVKAFPRVPVLTISAGGRAGLSMPIESSDIFLKKLHFKAEQLGSEEWVDLRLSMDQSFIPKALGSSHDDRELGLLVYHLHVVPADKIGSIVPSGQVEAQALSAAPAARPTPAARPARKPATS